MFKEDKSLEIKGNFLSPYLSSVEAFFFSDMIW